MRHWGPGLYSWQSRECYSKNDGFACLFRCCHQTPCPLHLSLPRPLCPSYRLPFAPIWQPALYAHETPCPSFLQMPCPLSQRSTVSFVPSKRPALCAHQATCIRAPQATCPWCLLYLKLASEVLGVPHSSREPALDQLLVGIPARRQGLCKRDQAKGEVIGQVVPYRRLVTVAHHLKNHCKACNGTGL